MRLQTRLRTSRLRRQSLTTLWRLMLAEQQWVLVMWPGRRVLLAKPALQLSLWLWLHPHPKELEMTLQLALSLQFALKLELALELKLVPLLKLAMEL